MKYVMRPSIRRGHNYASGRQLPHNAYGFAAAHVGRNGWRRPMHIMPYNLREYCGHGTGIHFV